tara:strand:+ start:457 stop:1128 length:672 start_codon:yes stop_codon:yes gene_type:complete
LSDEKKPGTNGKTKNDVKPVDSTSVFTSSPSPDSLLNRRKFLKTAFAIGSIATIAPFAPFAQFLLPGAGIESQEQKILLPKNEFANINDFPVDSKGVFVYPRTGDPELDLEPFRRFQLIRLPEELGGKANDISAFRAYSMICVHLWCLWDYKAERNRIECPCHGSMYDVETGLAFQGPAALQQPPNNALPQLSLRVDEEGNLWVKPPLWDTKNNGVVGYGRYV